MGFGLPNHLSWAKLIDSAEGCAISQFRETDCIGETRWQPNPEMPTPSSAARVGTFFYIRTY